MLTCFFLPPPRLTCPCRRRSNKEQPKTLSSSPTQASSARYLQAVRTICTTPSLRERCDTSTPTCVHWISRGGVCRSADTEGGRRAGAQERGGPSSRLASVVAAGGSALSADQMQQRVMAEGAKMRAAVELASSQINVLQRAVDRHALSPRRTLLVCRVSNPLLASCLARSLMLLLSLYVVLCG